MRGFSTEQLICAVEAMEKGGIKLVEVTFDQTGAVSDESTAENIRALKERFEGRVRIGAGTVMTEKQVKPAFNAGAEFIISPDCCEGVIQKTRELGMVSVPGVLTPTEAANAHRFGADFVKLFPNSEAGISYLKALAVPLSHIKFLAVGGVISENMMDYLNAGAKGIGVATAIADKKAIFAGDYEEITRRAKLFTSQLECFYYPANVVYLNRRNLPKELGTPFGVPSSFFLGCRGVRGICAERPPFRGMGTASGARWVSTAKSPRTFPWGLLFPSSLFTITSGIWRQ